MEAADDGQDHLLWLPHEAQEHGGVARVPAHLRAQAGAGERGHGEPGARRHRRDWLREDDPDDAVHGRGGLHLQGHHCMHAAATGGRHVGRQACGRGVWVPARPGSRLFNPLRGLHLARDGYQVHDRRHAAARVPCRYGAHSLFSHHARRGTRADHPHGRALWSAQGAAQAP